MTTGRSAERYFAADAEYQQELERLRLIESLGDPATIRHLETLGVGAGWRCLEVAGGAGSIARWMSARVGPDGRVVVTDIDVRFLHDLTAPNVEVRTHDVSKDKFESDSFDLVHCRSLLCHIGRPDSVLDGMAHALVPGGWMLAEEPDFGIIESVDKNHPFAAGFDIASDKRFRFLRDAGVMDGFLGKSLPSMMEAVGLDDVQHHGTARIARGGDSPSRNWLYVCDRLDGYLQSEGVLSEQEMADSRSALQDPTFRYLNALVFSVWGQRQK